MGSCIKMGEKRVCTCAHPGLRIRLDGFGLGWTGEVFGGGAEARTRPGVIGDSGHPVIRPGLTLYAVCLSGTEAVVSAARMISGGEADVVVAVGESLPLAPHVFPGARRDEVCCHAGAGHA